MTRKQLQINFLFISNFIKKLKKYITFNFFDIKLTLVYSFIIYKYKYLQLL